ncbi:hypothetical protein NE237_014761 [Protea cynaroides]|uniref:Pectinesterase n=1 Tax=Protea cynaroides TaxID=273540 RepID=A0A9Q0KCR0_9MAGN|nr:hypothetical protein NE237_014761 [Protea cynaroides]
MKSVEAVCSPTLDKDKCIITIAPVAANASAGPKDFLRAALVATLEEVKIWIEKPSTMKNDNLGRIDNMALDDCKKVLQFGVVDLEKALAMVDDNELQVVNDENICRDEIENPELKPKLQDVIRNATQLTTNALALFLSTILRSLNIPLEVNPKPARRLLDVAEHGLLLGKPPIPNAVVAKDGNGQVKTIAAALASHPKNLPPCKYQIHGPDKKTVIEDKRNKANYSTSQNVDANDFVAKDITFQNTASPPGEQAVALNVFGYRAAFFRCKIEGYQDSLSEESHRQFYHECIISGTIDFVSGQSATIIQHSTLVVKKPDPGQQNIVSADGTSEDKDCTHTGLVFQHCKIVAEKEFLEAKPPIQSFLGRPWKEYAFAIFMQTDIGSFIDPQGWRVWKPEEPRNKNCFFVGYANSGPGARIDGRVNPWISRNSHLPQERIWIHINNKKPEKFIVPPSYRGDLWLKGTGVPFSLGLNP